MTTITLESVCKRFWRASDTGRQPVIAVDDVSLKIKSGETLAILGPSACGKTTLLRLIAGLEKPDSGRILYDNADLQTIPVKERNIGMVFQEGGLAPHWKTRRSVGFYLELRKREDELPERIVRISEITGIGLDRLLERRPEQLSGGEQQRVSIARALARDLNVLLFDEPFANLDAKLRTEARVELKRLLREFPVTSIYVTHDQVEAIALSHRLAIMREGQIVQLGTYQQLYDRPMNLFMATFIGMPPINLFPGHIVDGRWQGENFGGYPIRRDLPDGTSVTLGVRPEHLGLADGGVPGVVDRVTPFYAERYQLVDVHLAGEQWSLQVPRQTRIVVGSTIYCAPDQDYLHYFDTDTGKRIG